ncbi:uncharacterized protein BXZ73DRAFT_98104 [Epithele typhae]|uniref:uncharacterized protein n=1 Tax=Epithele typhae TaxID=378194 RepID=UPI002007C2DB|nr:uncharacterized protein BXZ73DRAFT_98104 [Epithele typhae]KAH9941711.1 hypothetical protein BXZ73DRAFT_98104 [Epithele typhae]
MDISRLSREEHSSRSQIEFAIIERLRFDKAALKRCALVCRRWRYISQSHLFSFISLPSSRLADFVTTLSVNPTLGGHLRSIDFRGQANVGYVPLPLPLLGHLLCYLPHLSELYISSSSLEASYPYPPRMELTGGSWRPSSLDLLSFYNCTAPDSSVMPLLWLLCLFSRIGRLSITEANWEDGAVEEVPAEDCNTPAIHAITIESIPEDVDVCLFDLLEVSGSLAGPLRELDIHILRDRPGTPNLLTDIVDRGAQGLRKLRINICSLNRPCMLFEFVDLDFANLPALEELTLVVQRGGWTMNTVTNTSFLRAWLSIWTRFVRTAAPALHTVTLELDAMTESFGRFLASVRHACEHDQKHRDAWAALDAALAGRTPALRRVEVFVGEDRASVKAHIQGPLEELLRSCLAQTWATGRASFAWFEPWMVNDWARDAPPRVIVLNEEGEEFDFEDMVKGDDGSDDEEDMEEDGDESGEDDDMGDDDEFPGK